MREKKGESNLENEKDKQLEWLRKEIERELLRQEIDKQIELLSKRLGVK